MKRDIYQIITDRIVADLEKDVRPWHQPWRAAHSDGRIVLPRRHNGVAYRGVNILALWMAAVDKGYRSPIWMTFKQAADLGGAVRKGEKASLTVYADTIKLVEADDNGEEFEREIHYLKNYYVFNVEQIHGLPEAYSAKPEPRLDALPRNACAEAFFAATRANVRHGGDRAYYAVGSDHIQMPPFEKFRDAESYYVTLAHECTHWTRHESRLARSFGQNRFGDDGYAMEELVAELGAAFLCSDLQLTPDVRENHVSYLGHWLNVLRTDKQAIFTAAAHAQKAADYLHSLQRKAIKAAATYQPIHSRRRKKLCRLCAGR